ncbi:glucuronosyltransferase [Caenorhabditis elegans]|uniref:glucuronosyltransferase n=1 Tax=Caenorhabditis elegans TaxID=6239 RepID=H2KZ88_CAEEL|nr:glucuronosyltransferase [Caenorhabditis elegans]CCD67007.1 glucuronosyltransferase [Caenorhabditis elegans]|eukprot:NP_001123019.1 UDP-GlucuronosylTransferase [Caenorhabditis elegans]
MLPNNLLSILLVISLVSCKNILVYNPIFGYSHAKFVSQLANIIADHGHNTVFQPFHIALKNTDGLIKNKNIEIINYYPDHYAELLKKKTPTFPDFWDSHLMNNPVLSSFLMPKALGGEFEQTTTQLFQDQKILNDLKNRNFDVLLAETFEIAGFYIADLLEIPSIPLMSAVRLPIIDSAFGQPSILGYFPQQYSKVAPEAGFLDRLNDLYRIFFWNLTTQRLCQFQNDFIQKAIGHPVPHWRDLVKESPIYITNSNSYLDFAVPTTATIVHVGGITIDLEKMRHVAALTEEYENILAERESTVFISFGSVIRSYEMPDNFKAGIIKMFKSLPDVTFIWKYEKDDVKFQNRLPKNVHLKKWVPQPSLLADKRVKLFVTHGGLGSTMEVAYTGKPALMVPIFGDQPNNADMLARHGGAVAYDKFDLADGEKLTKTVRDMVTNSKYEVNAQELLKVLSKQPIDPKLNLMKHLEFAMEFPKHRSQVPAINRTGLIAHYYLDVIGVLTLASIFGLFVIFKILNILRKMISLRKVKRE